MSEQIDLHSVAGLTVGYQKFQDIWIGYRPWGRVMVKPMEVDLKRKKPSYPFLVLRTLLCLALLFFITSCGKNTETQTTSTSIGTASSKITFELGGTTIRTALSSFGPISIQVPENWIVINQSTSWSSLQSWPCSDEYIMVQNARPTGTPSASCPLISQPWTVAVLGSGSVLPTFNMKDIKLKENKTSIGNLSVNVSTFTVPQTAMMENNSDAMPSVAVIRGYIPKYDITFEFLSAVDVTSLRTPQDDVRAYPNLKAEESRLTASYVEHKFSTALGRDMLNSLRLLSN
ncbi:MAG: hypothetical protein HKL80_07825 [Acidimicrobiales bacterium]|nr:hypothetical protein [Acidimicrobiales bacterium]